MAIYDGLFLYYCNATCKALHLRAIASHIGDDVPTLDPPAVAERLSAALSSGKSVGEGPTVENGGGGDSQAASRAASQPAVARDGAEPAVGAMQGTPRTAA